MALDLTGLTTDEVNDKGFFTRAFPPDDVERLRAERQEGLLRGTPFELEIRALFKRGRYCWQLNQYNPLKDADPRIIRWYVTIDYQKRTEERLRNESLSDHDLIKGPSKPGAA